MKNKFYKIYIIITILIALAGLIFWVYLYNTDKYICNHDNGQWISIINDCNYPTTDGGKICSDSSQCQSNLCLANITDEELEILYSSDIPINKIIGRCENKSIFIGCTGLKIIDGELIELFCQNN